MKLRNLFAIIASASVCMSIHAEHLKSLDPKGTATSTKDGWIHIP